MKSRAQNKLSFNTHMMTYFVADLHL